MLRSAPPEEELMSVLFPGVEMPLLSLVSSPDTLGPRDLGLATHC